MNSSLLYFENRPRDWVVAFATCGFVTWFMMAYHAWWRLKPYSLGTLNECLALAGVFGLSLAVALGPLARLANSPSLLLWRRPFGVAGAVVGLIHPALTFTVLWPEYKFKWLADNLVASGFAFASTLFLVALVVFSFRNSAASAGETLRRKALLWSPWALVLVLVHYIVQGKIPSWIKWFDLHDKPMPPGTFPITLIALLALSIRLLDFTTRLSAKVKNV